jgi:hypothetical protein
MRFMRIPLFLLMVILGGFSVRAHAQVAGKETPELKALQSRYKTDVQAALKPLRERYLAQYESLARSFTTKGDLSAAVAVQEEINALKKAGNEDAGGTAVNRRELEKEVVGHWFYGSPKVWLGIRPEGKAYLEKAVLSWKVGAENSIILTDPQKPGTQATMEFDSRVESFTGKDFDGKRLSGTRKDRE